MSWWSWFPTLPSIEFSLPSGIQKRFISFALRHTLGHLLKPGQLDTQQIDSQIGSGYVQVRDVELDNKAIDPLLAGLPLQLHDGSLGKVTARIPLPNPLTSSVGLSLESLHLTFYIVHEAPDSSPVNASNLAESVASVADTFIHEELSGPEEATLRESFHSEPFASANTFSGHVPGGLDSFSSEEDLRGEVEPPGISLFASLVERLLSRFEFDAIDTRITIVHPEHASFTLTIEDLRYGADVPTPSSTTISPIDGTMRSVCIKGVSISTRSVVPPSPQLLSSHPSQDAPTINVSRRSSSEIRLPASPYSDSEMEEDTQILMSQSIAALPPRPISPTSSAASSMYESATSSSPSYGQSEDVQEKQAQASHSSTPSPPKRNPFESPSRRSSPPTRPVIDTEVEDSEDEIIFSLGADPIVIRAVMPSAAQAGADNQTSSSMPKSPSTKLSEEQHTDREDAKVSRSRVLHLTMQLPTIACALSARHIRSFIDIANVLASHPHPPAKVSPPKSSQPGGALFEHVEGSIQVRGVVAILHAAFPPQMHNPLADFFSRPLLPPPLPRSHMRIVMEGWHATFSLQNEPAPAGRAAQSKYAASTNQRLTASLSLSEFSIFAFQGAGSDGDLRASPVLITDPYLGSQYPTSHVHPQLERDDSQVRLPVFDVVDWTDPVHWPESTKLSHWRTHPPHKWTSSYRGSTVQGTDATASTSPRSKLATSTSPRSPGLSSPSSIPRTSGDTIPRAKHPAVCVKLTSTSSYSTSPRTNRTSSSSSLQVEIKLAPLHAFLDTALCLESDVPGNQSALLEFVHVLTAPKRDNGSSLDDEVSDADDDGDSDDGTHVGTPRAGTPFRFGQLEREREKERKRLERLVLDDLDLDLDYTHDTPTKKRQQTPPTRPHRKVRESKARTAVSVEVPTLRLQIRGPLKSHPTRSGAVVLDIHDLHIHPGGESGEPSRDDSPSVKFGYPDTFESASDSGNNLLSCNWQRLLVAYCPVHEHRAATIVSIGPLSAQDQIPSTTGGVDIEGTTYSRKRQMPRPRILVSKSSTNLASSTLKLSTLAIALEIPSVHCELSKPSFDGLQLWADDLSRLIDGALTPSTAHDSHDDSHASSIIGSRYFSKSRSRSSGVNTPSTVTQTRQAPSSETVLKTSVTEVAFRLLLPRSDGARPTRPFDVIASDLDLLLEVKPEGKDETVITIGLMDLTVIGHTPDGSTSTLVSLTIPRNLTPTIRSLLKLRFTSLVLAGTTAKESRVRMTICGVNYTFISDLTWIEELADFAKAPPGVFESVVPSERTHVSLKLVDTSIRLVAPTNPGSVVIYVGETDFSTVLVGGVQETSFQLFLQSLSLLLIDDVKSGAMDEGERDVANRVNAAGTALWKNEGYALLAEVEDLELGFQRSNSISVSDTRVSIGKGNLRVHLCADTVTALNTFIPDFISIFSAPNEPLLKAERREPTALSEPAWSRRGIIASLDEDAFRRAPEVGPAPDMIYDDLPTNLEYLDDSFSASAGLRELPSDDEPDEFDYHHSAMNNTDGVISQNGGETIRMLEPHLQMVEHYFDTLPPESLDEGLQYGDTTLRLRIQNCDVALFLYNGYDWARTRRIIEEEAKTVRRRLAKIRQLVASGQTPDPSVEETNTLLFNSVYIGLEHNVDELEPDDLIAAIDDELGEDSEVGSQSSWQSFKPRSPTHAPSSLRSTHFRRKTLTRSRGPSIEFRLSGLCTEIDYYKADPELASRTLVTVRDIEILDHIKTSTWKKFLTDLRTNSQGNIRETDSNMARIELRKVYPVPGNATEEARLRAKILPLRLHVDQDALDFLKKFFNFKEPNSAPAQPSNSDEEIFFQQAEVFPVDIKLDYKPRRVDYRALRDGRTIELMNFFHFDGAEMTLRHIVLRGITGWPRFFDLLNDIWTPDVKATQLVDVISGVAPIRSVVNVGSGVADLVLLPISQYRKDGRVVRGLQKGTTAFVRSTAIEAIKLGARLATGTQVILEQAEDVLGGQFKDPITAEALQVNPIVDADDTPDGAEREDLISRYADQPTNVREGVQFAYKSMRRNLNSAAQTILAVPMEVYERSGTEGTVRAVVRAVPIAVLKPMIGASEAISKTLLGLHNTLDPGVRLENEAKYKQR